MTGLKSGFCVWPHSVLIQPAFFFLADLLDFSLFCGLRSLMEVNNVVGINHKKRPIVYLLDMHFNVVPVHNMLNVDWSSLSDSWIYQTMLPNNEIISSTFLSVDFFNPYADIYRPTVFETAFLKADSVSVLGRFSSLDECIAFHHDYLESK